MKTKLSLIILSMTLAFVGCKKDDSTDPRDKYIGTWYGTETQVFTELGISDTYNVNYAITKSAVANEIIVTNSESSELSYTAIVDGNQHTYKKFSYYENDQGFTIYYEQEGTGIIADSQISENGTMLSSISGYDYYGTWFRTLIKN